MTGNVKYSDGKFILTLPKEQFKVLLRGLIKAKEEDIKVEELLTQLEDDFDLMKIDLEAIAKEKILEEIPF